MSNVCKQGEAKFIAILIIITQVLSVLLFIVSLFIQNNSQILDSSTELSSINENALTLMSLPEASLR